MSPELSEIYHRHAAAVFARQMRLQELVAQKTANFQLQPGTLSFGPGLTWRAQLLGTRAAKSNTWLWAWANTVSNLPPSLLTDALALKETGTRLGVPELRDPQWPMADDDAGHRLAIACAGLCNADAYYRGPLKDASLFLLIKDPAYPHRQDDPWRLLPFVFPQVVATYPVEDHRKAFLGYLETLGLQGRADGSDVDVLDGDRPRVRAGFDELNRLTKLETLKNP